MKRIQIRKNWFSKSNSIACLAGLFVILTIGAPHIPSPQVQLPEEIPGSLASGIQPKACIGYDTLKQKWGAEHGFCPAHYAFFGVDDPAGAAGPAERISVSMSCCPLPAEDILTQEHVFAPSECPENYVATGSKRTGSKENTLVSMRCTKINTERYQLGEKTRGVYWGDGSSGWRGSRRIARDNIPVSMRFAHGRQTADAWDIDGCVGYPWGSLLTEKQSKHCGSFSFKQLQFSGKTAADPAAGTPVQMIPKCNSVDRLDTSVTPACHS